MKYLGDFAENQTLGFYWEHFDAAGGSAPRTTAGSMYVQKMGHATSTTGLSDLSGGEEGFSRVNLVTTDAFYAPGYDYSIMLLGTVIDGETINTILAHFSIENRTNETVKTLLAAAQAILEADTEIDLTTDPTQATLNYKTKGTSSVILKKNLVKPDGNPVTSEDDRIAAEENVEL